MSTTYLTLVNNVLNELNESELTSTTFSSSRGIQSSIKKFVVKAMHEIYNSVSEIPDLYISTTQDTNAGQREYNLPTTDSPQTGDLEWRKIDWDTVYLKPKELVTNGEFTSNINSWTTIAGAGSAAYNSGGNGRLRLNDYAAYQAITTSKNTEYRIQVKVYDSNSVGQALKVQVGTAAEGTQNLSTTLTVENFGEGAVLDTVFTATAQTSYITVNNTSTATSQAPSGVESYDEINNSQMRKAIARSLAASLFTAPHFYLTMKINMDAAIQARTLLNEDANTKISFNDMIVKATALSLKQHPKVNSSWMGDFIRENYHVNIGIAVAVDEGLLVPVLRFADSLSLSQISGNVKEFAKKAKEKKLQPADWEGSTFTISNLGMFGIDSFTAIINPPDACILAVGGISQEPVVKGGQVVPGNVMNVTLSCDHRVVDGATGSAFLQTLKRLLEEPLRMFL